MDSFFNNEDYMQFLLELCNDDKGEDQGRVVGGQNIIDILDILDIQKGDKVLEIGCGTGRVLKLLVDEYGADVYGCDVAAVALDYIKQNRPEFRDRVWFIDSYGLAHYPTNTFDFAVYWGVFELVAQVPHLVQLSSLLKLGGRAMLSGVKQSNPRGDDETAQAALVAYAKKSYPINVNDVALLERQMKFLGFEIEKRLVFEKRSDVADKKYLVDQGGDIQFGEAVYIIKKVMETPLSRPSNKFFGKKPTIY